jgi:formylglycine-generating enzyme
MLGETKAASLPHPRNFKYRWAHQKYISLTFFQIMKSRTALITIPLISWLFAGRVILQANDAVVTNISMVPRLTIQSDAGAPAEIQRSINLGDTNWTVLSSFVVAESPFSFVDLNAGGQPLGFYRLVVLHQTNNPAPTSMSSIPAGTFVMGDTIDATTGATPEHTSYVSGFYMDKFEVTKALWDEVYLWATDHGYSFDNAGRGMAADHPVQMVSWYDCVKWCNARSEKEGRVPAYYVDTGEGCSMRYRTGQQIPYVSWNSGYRLPTEAEWEKAARGGAAGHRFPWVDADTITQDRANYKSGTSNFYAHLWDYDLNPTRGFHPIFATNGLPYTSPVGYFASNGYGLYDMAGNVYEWCWDWYGRYTGDTQSDPRGPKSGTGRVVRGGSWFRDAFICRVDKRGSHKPTEVYDRVGFRCVLPPGQ